MSRGHRLYRVGDWEVLVMTIIWFVVWVCNDYPSFSLTTFSSPSPWLIGLAICLVIDVCKFARD